MSDSDELDKPAGLWRSRGPAQAPRAPGARTAAGETAETATDDALPETVRYQAFKAVDGNLFCLSIYTNGPANAHPAYQYYQYMTEDGNGKIFDIVFAFFVVRVRGRNLAPVLHAIKSKRCVFIQQYQRRAEWPSPEPGEPLIEKIEIVYHPAARTAMLEKGGLAS